MVSHNIHFFCLVKPDMRVETAEVALKSLSSCNGKCNLCQASVIVNQLQILDGAKGLARQTKSIGLTFLTNVDKRATILAMVQLLKENGIRPSRTIIWVEMEAK